MNITLSNKNNTDIYIIPIVPPRIPVRQPTKNEVFEAIKGDINIIKKKGLKEYAWESFFPVNKKYTFVKAGCRQNGWEYVDFIDNCVDKELPLRIVVTTDDKHTVLNMLASVDYWDHALDEVGDIVYSIGLREYKDNV